MFLTLGVSRNFLVLHQKTVMFYDTSRIYCLSLENYTRQPTIMHFGFNATLLLTVTFGSWTRRYARWIRSPLREMVQVTFLPNVWSLKLPSKTDYTLSAANLRFSAPFPIFDILVLIIKREKFGGLLTHNHLVSEPSWLLDNDTEYYQAWLRIVLNYICVITFVSDN